MKQPKIYVQKEKQKQKELFTIQQETESKNDRMESLEVNPQARD